MVFEVQPQHSSLFLFALYLVIIPVVLHCVNQHRLRVFLCNGCSLLPLFGYYRFHLRCRLRIPMSLARCCGPAGTLYVAISVQEGSPQGDLAALRWVGSVESRVRVSVDALVLLGEFRGRNHFALLRLVWVIG